VRRFRQWGAASAPLLLALCLSRPLHSQVTSPDTTPLTFLGLPAGVSLDQLSIHLRSLAAPPLHCVRSTRDQSVQECRGAYRDSANGGTVDLWLSAIDSLSGILSLSHRGSETRLVRWRDDLERRYGPVPTRVQGAQRMKQWVRRGRMIRLTWRREAGVTVISVSLVDGRVLDGWGQRKNVPGEQ
jgi:hypothetical protein